MAKVAEIGTEEAETVDTAGQPAVEASVEDRSADADLESGYADAPTDVSTEPVVPPVVDAAASDTDPEPIYAKITEDEYKRFLSNAETVDKIASSLEQRFGTAFGHIGGLQQKLKEMQDATPRGQGVTLTKDDFAEMQAEFPELADMQMKGLERALSRMSGTGSAPGLDEAKTGELVEGRLATFEKKILMDTLTDLHEDWETVVGPKDSTTPFRTWLATQPQEYRNKITDSRRPAVIAQSISKFKEFAATSPAKPSGSAPRTNVAADERRAQLKSAVMPKGAGGAKVGRTALDDLQEAFDNA